MNFSEKYGALLKAIANEADAIAMKYFRTEQIGLERKHDGTVVTKADRLIEEMARTEVAASGLQLDIVGEETASEIPKSPRRDGRARMIIDPIDGTEEFSRGIPKFGMLVAMEENGEIVAGMVSAPAMETGTRWWAYRGEGAFRNGRRIHVSRIGRISDAMVYISGTGPSKKMETRTKMRRMADAARTSRSVGGFWQHMLVAEGAIEAAVDCYSKPWDLAPLGIIVEEAGGKSTTLSGERSIYRGQLVSTNGLVHEEVLRLLK